MAESSSSHPRSEKHPTSNGIQKPPQDLPSVDLAQRLKYLELSESDAARLRDLLPQFEAYVEPFVEGFYAHLFQFEHTSRFITDPKLVARLKETQKDHLRSTLAANWNTEFLARRRAVGDMHAQVGIDPQIFLGAYSQYVGYFFRLSADQEQLPPAFTESMLSLFKAVFLDVELTLEAYFTGLTRKLRQALEMVWQANTQLRQFAQLTSHDLKTPLATVTNLCEEALDEFGAEIPVEARKLIEAAKNRAFRMSQTIDELLASTLSTRPAEEEEEFASEQVILEAVDRVRPVLEEREIELQISSVLPWVRGDRVQIREAFYNLISNAAKFIERKPGSIQISAEVHGPDCLFCVCDNGPGIPKEELDRIFVPFRRLPTHRDKPGSGLGLYFTKNLIEQQGGRVWAESELGQGARFFILLHREPPLGS